MQFRKDDIETIVKCFGSEFERYAPSKLVWLSKFEIENVRTTSERLASLRYGYC